MGNFDHASWREQLVKGLLGMLCMSAGLRLTSASRRGLCSLLTPALQSLRKRQRDATRDLEVLLHRQDHDQADVAVLHESITTLDALFLISSLDLSATAFPAMLAAPPEALFGVTFFVDAALGASNAFAALAYWPSAASSMHRRCLRSLLRSCRRRAYP